MSFAILEKILMRDYKEKKEILNSVDYYNNDKFHTPTFIKIEGELRYIEMLFQTIFEQSIMEVINNE